MNQLVQLTVNVPVKLCPCKLYTISPLSTNMQGLFLLVTENKIMAKEAALVAEVKALWQKETDLWHNNEIVASAREKEPCGRRRSPVAEEQDLWHKERAYEEGYGRIKL